MTTTMNLKDFTEVIAAAEGEVFLLVCSELVVFDQATMTVYLPAASHGNALMNPMGDFRTILGHGLLWSRHIELDCTSYELWNALYHSDFVLELDEQTRNYTTYKMKVHATATRRDPIPA